MVLLSAGICTKTGRAVVARQFVEMTRSRVEGLYAAFPKLLSESQQHTFVETESVRYVYQPIEQLYMVLVTTKTSNILEDLETLHLFARVIPEYCRSLDERDISDNVFELIFAFDEIVALGYRESVTIAQVRTFTEMDSHEEKVFQMVQKNKEKEAKEEMKRKMKELESARRAERKGRGGPKGYGSAATGFGSGSAGMSDMGMGGQIPPSRSGGFKSGGGSSSGISGGIGGGPTTTTMPSRGGGGAGMKLGGKKDGDAFLGQLMAEGVNVGNSMSSGNTGSPLTLAAAKRQPSLTHGIPTHQEKVHIKIEERITLTAMRDGGLENMEVKGDLVLRVSDPDCSRIALRVLGPDQNTKPFQYKTHPNCNKQLFAEQGIVTLKNPSKGFPVGADQGVLKYRCATTDDSLVPLSINCWPSPNSNGTCDVNIEYDLDDQSLSLEKVIISIPLPSGKPEIGNVEGDAVYNSREHLLEWSIPIIDSSSPTGSMEFTAPARDPNDFFPIMCNFVSSTSFSGMAIEAVIGDGDANIPFSTESTFSVDSYQVV
eukprot:CFRG2837T1